ncbi:MAG: MGMT family protein [Chloroflexota bacterium]|jgi:methylated-DNA-protein-cysteine methyltransferase related protein
MPDTLPPDPEAYYQQVWTLVRQVPPGKVATYGQIAQLLPLPLGVEPETYKAFAPRWVGSAMAASPPDVPWQRVINAQGKISQRPGAERQRQLLAQEGVLFVKDKVDLKVYKWTGSGEEDEPRQATLF